MEIRYDFYEGTYTPTIHSDNYGVYDSENSRWIYFSDANPCAGFLVKTNVAVKKVELNKDTLSLNVGSSETLTASITPSDATEKTVTWTSSNTSVATVSNGIVKGIKEGTATIICTTDGTDKNGNKLSATCEVTVMNSDVPVSGVELEPTSLTLTKGETSQLTAIVLPTNATNKSVTWKSGNSKIASVSTSGLVKGVKAGTTYIWVKTVDGGYSAKCKVTVKDTIIHVTGVKISPTSLTLTKGKTSQLTATVLPTNATNKSVTWKSSNSKIASVSTSGLVKGVKAGTTYIWVKTVDGSYSAKCKVTVKEGYILPTAVNIYAYGYRDGEYDYYNVSRGQCETSIGTSWQFYAEITPTNATNKSVIK